MFFPRNESAIPACDQQENSEKVEVEVPSNAPQGGDTVPHSRNEDHTEETNSDSHDILGSDNRLHITTPLLVTGCKEPLKSMYTISLIMKMD